MDFRKLQLLLQHTTLAKMKLSGAHKLPWLLVQFSLYSNTECAVKSHIGIERQEKSGNPILEGWYADPDARIFEN